MPGNLPVGASIACRSKSAAAFFRHTTRKEVYVKVLVTGGAGYIGSIATAELVKDGHTVVVFDNLYQGHREAVHPDAAFVEGDLRDPDAVARLFTEHTGFDGIMHFASFTLVGESMQQPLKYLRENLVAGANLLEQAVAHDIGRFILS